MPTSPRTPAEHYAEAERILAALPRHGLDPAQLVVLEPLAAVAHAVLATAPRRARRAARHDQRTRGGSPAERWLHGDQDDQKGGTA